MFFSFYLSFSRPANLQDGHSNAQSNSTFLVYSSCAGSHDRADVSPMCEKAPPIDLQNKSNLLPQTAIPRQIGRRDCPYEPFLPRHEIRGSIVSCSFVFSPIKFTIRALIRARNLVCDHLPAAFEAVPNLVGKGEVVKLIHDSPGQAPRLFYARLQPHPTMSTFPGICRVPRRRS